MTCEKDAQTESMTCITCLDRFHVNNCEGEDQCTTTFLRGWPNILAKYPNFGYTCEDCLEKSKLNNGDILVNRLAVMEENIAFLVKEIKTMKQVPSTSNTINDTLPVLPPPVISYAEKAARKPAVIVIEKKQGEDAEMHNTNMNKLKDAAVQSSAGVLKTYQNGVESTVLVCKNESSKQKLMPHVGTIFPEHKVSTPPSRLPSITIKDIETNITKDELLRAIQKQNRDHEQVEVTQENFNILFIKQVKGFNNRPDSYQAVVRVTDEIRDSLKAAGDRVFINLQSCPVSKRLFVRRCNKCQEFRHFHKECKSEFSICGKCGDHHDTRQCLSPTTKCINCSNHGLNDINHETSWSKCPCYKKEQDRLEKTIPYYNPKNI